MKNAKLYAQMAILGGILGDSSSVAGHTDPSTKVRKEVCPNCGEPHNRSGHIFCSDKCQEERRTKLKNGELE